MVVDEVNRYVEGARAVVETDEDFKRENPDMTIKDYALEQVEGDMESARLTGQWEWVRELKQIARIINKGIY